MVTWYPDFCPTGQCMIELEKFATGTSIVPAHWAVDVLEGVVWIEEREVTNYALKWDVPKRVISLCPHHQNVKSTHALDDTGVFTAILRSCQAKEKARWALKLDFMANGTVDDDYDGGKAIDKEWPGAKFKVDPNGDIIIERGTIRIPPQARQRLSKLVDDESKKIEQVPGISRILLE